MGDTLVNGKCGGSAGSDSVTRPHYLPGTYLSAGVCSLEQHYRLQRLRRHNRNLHEWGVICGLWVVPGGDPVHPWLVRVCPGYAIGPQGDEIEVRSAAELDISDSFWYRPASREGRLAYVAIRYDSEPDELRPVPGGACECRNPVYSESRQRDSFALGVLWTLPRSPSSAGICNPHSPPCPECPDSPWLVLARIILPADPARITKAMIDNVNR